MPNHTFLSVFHWDKLTYLKWRFFQLTFMKDLTVQRSKWIQFFKDLMNISFYVQNTFGFPVTPTKRFDGESVIDLSDIFTSNIVFFPLFFRDSLDEQHFIEFLLSVFRLRVKIASLASIGFYFIYWLFTLLCFIKPTAFRWNVVAHVLYSMSILCVIGFYCVLYLLIKTSYLARDFEYIFNIFILMSACVQVFWTIFYTILQSRDLNENAKMYLNISTYVISIWSFILMDAIVQIRTKTSFFNHIAICLIVTVAHTVQIIIIKRNESSNICPNKSVLFHCLVSMLYSFCIFTCIMIVFYTRRWFVELQERMEFLQRKKAAEELAEFKGSYAKRKGKKGATIVEHLTALVEKIVCNINEILVETTLPSLVEALDLMKQCQEILTDTTNLYSVRCQVLCDELSTERDHFNEAFHHRSTASYRGLSSRDLICQEGVAEFLQNSGYISMDRTYSGSFEHQGTLQSYGLLGSRKVRKSSYYIPTLLPTLTMESCDTFHIGRSWECNMLRLAQKYPNIILEVGVTLLQNKLEAVNSTPLCLYNYLYRLQSCYQENPYHNKVHAAAVAHATSCLMNMLYIHESSHHSFINDIAIIIAALGHDAGHPGRSNSFFVNTSDNLALIYNDISILENTHSAIIFKCLEIPGANIFAEVSPDVFCKIRKRIIEMILITDMGNHFESVSRFRLRQQALGFNYLRDPEDMWLVIRMCLKCADLSHTMVDWPQHLDWSLRVVEEFYQQGDQEKALGLKVSPLFDRSFHYGFCKAQRGFLEFIVQPLMTQMEELEHGSTIREECGQKLESNKAKWDELVAQCINPEIPQEYQDMKTNPRFSVQIVVSLYIQNKVLVPLKMKKQSVGKVYC